MDVSMLANQQRLYPLRVETWGSLDNLLGVIDLCCPCNLAMKLFKVSSFNTNNLVIGSNWTSQVYSISGWSPGGRTAFFFLKHGIKNLPSHLAAVLAKEPNYILDI